MDTTEGEGIWVEGKEFSQFVKKGKKSKLPSHETIETRKPILDKESAEKFNFEGIDKQWLLVTERIRRNILENSETRGIAAEYAKIPVSESLPCDFLLKISLHDDVSKLIDRYKESLMTFLGLPAVPDENITSDITHAPSLSVPKDLIAIMDSSSFYSNDEVAYQELLQSHIDRGFFTKGVTFYERKMIAQRYRFARDVKMLAFIADSLLQSDNIPVANSEKTLPSGIEVVLNTKDEQKIGELTDPSQWLKRKQLKDRVYELQVGESKYLLKEKKTNRHTDTKKGGHRPGSSSAEEFATAQYFKEHAVVKEGDIKINWEEPVACVVFPDEVMSPDGKTKKDAFQFTVFKYQQGLLEQKLVVQNLTNEILSHKAQFEGEFEEIKELSKKFANEKRVMAFEPKSKKREAPIFTFEDYAAIKAYRMERQARNLMQETILKNGYDNSDQDGYAYKINIENNKVQLEIFGFDFEYFHKIQGGQKEVDERIKRNRDYDQEYEGGHGLNFTYWSSSGSRVNRMQKAGYFALLEKEDILKSKTKDKNL